MPWSVGAIEPVGMMNASASNPRKSKASKIATSIDSNPSRNNAADFSSFGATFRPFFFADFLVVDFELFFMLLA